MNLEAMMSLEGLVIITLVVAAAGTAMTNLFRNARTAYLVTISGSRIELITYGAILWAVALSAGFVALFLVSALASPVVGVAVFFGIEAVALDICAHRTRYIHCAAPEPVRARVQVTLPFGP
jgi:hypothetical protein